MGTKKASKLYRIVKFFIKMVKYTKKVTNPTESVKAKGSNLRVHFKNTRETAAVIKGKTLNKAIQFLKDVKEQKQGVPFRVFNGGPGRHAHMHFKATQVRWPVKSCDFLLGLLQNIKSNAEFKQLDVDRLRLTHVSVQAAAKTRRRVYRAHGRINAFKASPCHIEIVATQLQKPVRRKLAKRFKKAKKAPAKVSRVDLLPKAEAKQE